MKDTEDRNLVQPNPIDDEPTAKRCSHRNPAKFLDF